MTTYRTLTPVHERNLVRRYRRGIEAAGTELATIHEPYMRARARVYVRDPFFTFDDALQAARIGFFKGVMKFDTKAGVRLLTYASWWIMHELQRQQRSVVGEARPGVNAQGRGTRPIYALRLDSPLPREIGGTLLDLLASNDTSPEDVAHEKRLQARMRAIYVKALATLTPRERTIAVERLARHEKDRTTMEALGKRLGISRERVRQIEVQLKAKLRKRLTRMGARELVAA